MTQTAIEILIAVAIIGSLASLADSFVMARNILKKGK